jgi:5-methylcytosine-specific restriction endonuclease McrA
MRPAWLKRIYNSADWKATRLATLERDQYTCVRCGEYADTAHHKVAIEEGGAPFDLANTVTLCRPCHAVVDNARLGGYEPARYVRKVNRFLNTVLRSTPPLKR